jgi:S1-C subfamily serine protease
VAPAAGVGTAAIDFPSIVERYGPAVVNIVASGDAREAQPASADPLDGADPFVAFFARPPRPGQAQSQDGPRAIIGSGSGFIVSADGLILTAAHVVDDADEVTVRLTDKREFKAKVLAVDGPSGVAVLQIDASKLPTVKLGDSSRVRPGEPVLTIGSPDGLDNAVTAGIVSTTSRVLPDGSSFPFFQTDVALNPDNSGGPIFNRAGEVVGIDVQVYADADGYNSLTFAIPINTANKVRTQLQAQKPPPGNGLGVEVEDVSAGLAAAVGLPRAAGALVDTVDAGSPAAVAGLMAGDVIVRIGEKPIGRSAEFMNEAAALPPGATAPMKLIRNRRWMTTTLAVAAVGDSSGSNGDDAADVTPVAVQVADDSGAGPVADGAFASGRAAAAGTVPVRLAAPAAAGTERLGLVMHALSESERRSTGLPLGLMVDDVRNPAAKAGVRRGDVVLSLNETLVETPEQANQIVARSGKTVSLLIQRNNARSFVSVRLR